jgi:hypothetical protein
MFSSAHNELYEPKAEFMFGGDYALIIPPSLQNVTPYIEVLKTAGAAYYRASRFAF